MHNALIVSPTEMHQSAVMVITNYAGSISDSSPLPLTDSDTARSTLKRTKQSGTVGQEGGVEGGWTERVARRGQGEMLESKRGDGRKEGQEMGGV